jgi:hypothetical protein
MLLKTFVWSSLALELSERNIVDRLDEFRPDRNLKLIKRY